MRNFLDIFSTLNLRISVRSFLPSSFTLFFNINRCQPHTEKVKIDHWLRTRLKIGQLKLIITHN